MTGDISDAQRHPKPDRVYVLVDGGEGTVGRIHLGRHLAEADGVPWEAIFADTPANTDPGQLRVAGEALALAARLGAAVYRLPAATVADAVVDHIAASASPHIVVPVEVRSWLRRAARRSLIEELAVRCPQTIFHGTGGEPAVMPIGPHFGGVT